MRFITSILGARYRKPVVKSQELPDAVKVERVAGQVDRVKQAKPVRLTNKPIQIISQESEHGISDRSDH
jgi:hypothetical protein